MNVCTWVHLGALACTKEHLRALGNTCAHLEQANTGRSIEKKGCNVLIIVTALLSILNSRLTQSSSFQKKRESSSLLRAGRKDS